MADMSSENAYQASLVTRDRALAARSEAIDVLKRLIAQMEDDPNMVKVRENLEKILENPEVITDEVFANIMSKTNEVLDSNYETQVQDLIAQAKSRGISGPALQVQLQRAKEARASAMTGALRDAVIQRSQEGLQTQLSAVQAAANTLSQFFQNKSVMTKTLVDELNQIVEEPFRNEGPGQLPQAAGGAGGMGGGRPITMDFSGVDDPNSFLNRERNFVRDDVTGELVAPEVAAQRAADRKAETDMINANAMQKEAELNAQLAKMGGTAQAQPGGVSPVKPITPESIKTGAKPAAPAGQSTITDENGQEVPLDVYLKRAKGRDVVTKVPGNFDFSKLIQTPNSPSAVNNDQFKALEGALAGFAGLGSQIKNIWQPNDNQVPGESPNASGGGGGFNFGFGSGGGGGTQTQFTPIMTQKGPVYGADPFITDSEGRTGVRLDTYRDPKTGKVSSGVDTRGNPNTPAQTSTTNPAYAAAEAAAKAGYTQGQLGKSWVLNPDDKYLTHAKFDSKGNVISITTGPNGQTALSPTMSSGAKTVQKSGGTTTSWSPTSVGSQLVQKVSSSPAAKSAVSGAALAGPIGAASSITQSLIKKFFGGTK